MEITIRSMMEQDRQEVLQMMRVFYASDAVQSNGSEEIFEKDICNCVEENPYLEGYIFEKEGKVLGYAMAAKSFSTGFGKPCIWNRRMKEQSMCIKKQDMKCCHIWR